MISHDETFSQIQPFSKSRNWQVGNWQIATDILITIIRAQSQNLLQGFKDGITRNICDIPKLKNSF